MSFRSRQTTPRGSTATSAPGTSATGIAKGLPIMSLAHRPNTLSIGERAAPVVNLNGFRPTAQKGIVVSKEKQASMRLVLNSGGRRLRAVNDDDDDDDDDGLRDQFPIPPTAEPTSSGTPQMAKAKDGKQAAKKRVNVVSIMGRAGVGGIEEGASSSSSDDDDGAGSNKSGGSRPSSSAAKLRPMQRLQSVTKKVRSVQSLLLLRKDRQFDTVTTSVDPATSSTSERSFTPSTNTLGPISTSSVTTSSYVKGLLGSFPQGGKRNWQDAMLHELTVWHISDDLRKLVCEDAPIRPKRQQPVIPRTTSPLPPPQPSPPPDVDTGDSKGRGSIVVGDLKGRGSIVGGDLKGRGSIVGGDLKGRGSIVGGDLKGRGSIALHCTNIMLRTSNVRESVEHVRRPLPPPLPPPDPEEQEETDHRKKQEALEKKQRDEESKDPNRLFADLMFLLSNTAAVEDLGLLNCVHPFDTMKILVMCHRGLLVSPSNITKLCISLCHMTDEGLSALCEYIAQTPRKTITNLDVSHNAITHVGAASVATVLPGSSVRSLNLHGNPLGPLSTQALIDIMIECYQLHELDIGFCRLNTQVGDVLFSYFGSITTLQKLSLDGMSISTNSAMTLLRCLNTNRSFTSLSLRFSTACNTKAFTERLSALMVRNERFLEARRQNMLARGTDGSTASFHSTRKLSASNSSRRQQQQQDPAAAAGGVSAPPVLDGSVAHLESTLLLEEDADELEPIRRCGSEGALPVGYETYTTNEPTKPCWMAQPLHPQQDSGKAGGGQKGTSGGGGRRSSNAETSSTATTASAVASAHGALAYGSAAHAPTKPKGGSTTRPHPVG